MARAPHRPGEHDGVDTPALSLLLPAIAFAPVFPLAAACHLLRECLVEMDVPTRTSYAMALVRPEERTAAAGWTNLTRLADWAVGPAIAGALMGS